MGVNMDNELGQIWKKNWGAYERSDKCWEDESLHCICGCLCIIMMVIHPTTPDDDDDDYDGHEYMKIYKTFRELQLIYYCWLGRREAGQNGFH